MNFKKKSLLSLLLLAPFLISCSDTGNGGNDDNSLRVNLYWDLNFTNNYFCGMNVQPATYFMVEGLYHRLDTVDYVTPIIADGMPIYSNDGLTSTVKIKENATWHNGEDFTSKDVWAYYMMQHTTVTNYLLSISTPNDKTVEFHWNPAKPITNDIKTKLLALDKNGSIKYTEYKQFVDCAARLLDRCSTADFTRTSSTPFGKEIDVETSTEYSVNYNNFKNSNPPFYCATGPFKIDKYSPTKMILVKNLDYWAANEIKFDKVVAYSYSDNNHVYNGLVSNNIYYYDGLPEETSLESILSQNEDLIHLKMLDIDTVGLNFNMKKDVWQNPKVRKAFQYIFDRDEIKNLSNPYGITNEYASNSMPLSEIKKHISEEHINKLTKYSKDINLAANLLNEAGWSKNDGLWHDGEGKRVSLTIASSNAHPVWTNAAVAVQAALQSFGINTILKLVDQTAMYQNGQDENSPYDAVVMWTELNDTISHPYGSFNSFKNLYGYFTHLPRFNRGDIVGNGTAYAGDINMEFPWIDGGVGMNGRTTLNYSEYMNNLYALDGETLEKITASVVCGMAEYMYGVNFFQNVTGSVWNARTIDGISFKEKWSNERNLTYIPDITTEDAKLMALMNIKWSASTALIDGTLKPKK